MRGIINKIKDNRGAATIMEATIVFPIMIVVIVFLIYLGNGMFLMSKVSAAVARNAVNGAAMCTDPYYYLLEGKSSVPDSLNKQIEPYRYLLQTDKGHISEVKTKIYETVKSEIDSEGFFLGMKPKVEFADVKYNNKFFYSTFSVEVRYKIVMGTKLWGERDYRILESSEYSEVGVNDPVDFIRNADMAIDYVEGNKEAAGVVDKINKAFGKVKEFLNL